MRLQVTIAETGITSPGQSRRIKGEGMPVHNFPSDRGDLVVRYKLKMPGSLTDEQRQLLEQVRTLRLSFAPCDASLRWMTWLRPFLFLATDSPHHAQNPTRRLSLHTAVAVRFC
eukprot:COSAG04_NODE_4139_length_2275_cov_1.747702_3_plen_114_part_00